MAISKEFIVQLQGRDFALFAGLLDAATKAGLKSVSTDIHQVPSAENGRMAVMQATVEFEDGRTFQAVGDASPESVGRMIVPHLLRMAETRAIGRALRWALNVSVTMKEELGGDEETPSGHNGHQSASQPRQRAAYDPEDNETRKATVEAAAGLCEDCAVPVPGPVAVASRKRFDGAVLCLKCGKARQQAANGTPAQLQGM